MTPMRGSGTQASQKDTYGSTGARRCAGALTAFAALAGLMLAPVPAGASGMDFNPGAHLTFSMPFGGTPETDLDVTLDIRNGHRRIVTFELHGGESGERVRLGENRRIDWRADYQRMLDLERDSPHISTERAHQQRRHSAGLPTPSRAAGPRMRYLALLARYEAASLAKQRELYPELQRAYQAALDGR